MAFSHFLNSVTSAGLASPVAMSEVEFSAESDEVDLVDHSATRLDRLNSPD